MYLHADLLQSANDEIKKARREIWKPEPELIPNIQVYHYHNDHLGTPNELTNDKGEVVWLAEYEAWGNTAKIVWREEQLEQLKVSAEELQPLRFQGQFIDQKTGLYYNRFRYYDPDLGMFTTRDPIGLLGGNNVFQYAPNPVGWVDPWGLLELGQVAPYGSRAHVGDNLDAHEMLRNAFLKDSPLTDITTRRGARGNPAMALSKSLHQEVHEVEARLRAERGMGRNQFFKRGKDEIRIMYQAMQEVLVDRHGIITQRQLRNMRAQAIKFAKSKKCY